MSFRINTRHVSLRHQHLNCAAVGGVGSPGFAQKQPISIVAFTCTKELVEIVKADPTRLKPPVFFNWVRNNYVLAMCIGLRRLSDVRKDVVSVGRLLRELEIRPEVVSRRSYRALQRRRGILVDEADTAFDRLVGQSGARRELVRLWE